MKEAKERTEGINIPLVREGLVAFALLMNPTEAGAQSRQLEQIAALPASCEALAQDKGTVAACRTDMMTQGEALKSFIAGGGLGQLAFFQKGVSAEERCRMALTILEPRVNQLKEIAKFLEEEGKLPDSREALWKLFPGTVKDLSKMQGRQKVEPTKEELVVHLQSQIPQLPELFRRCSGSLYLGLTWALIGTVQDRTQARAPVLLAEMLKGINNTDNREHLKASVLAYVRFIEILREAAKIEAKR